jgi:hypothetical protein
MPKKIVNIRAAAGSGTANPGHRGTERDSGHIEVCTDRGRLAAYVRHRRGAEKDRRCGEVPGLSNSEENHEAKKAEAMNVALLTQPPVSSSDIFS